MGNRTLFLDVGVIKNVFIMYVSYEFIASKNCDLLDEQKYLVSSTLQSDK